jgi:hypothetical protein
MVELLLDRMTWPVFMEVDDQRQDCRYDQAA